MRPKTHAKTKKLALSLISLALISLSGCASCPSVPSFPAPQEGTAEELETFPNETKAPKFWEWMGRLEKLQRKLEN